MPPANTIAVIPLKSVVVIMVALTVGDQSKKRIVACRAIVAIGAGSPHVSKRINKVSGMLA